jgi:hypothetical protein
VPGVGVTFEMVGAVPGALIDGAPYCNNSAVVAAE